MHNSVHGYLREGARLDLRQGLQAFFEVHEAGIFTTCGYSIAVHRHPDGRRFSIVDSHCRNRRNGFVDPDGVAVFVHLYTLNDMVWHILELFASNEQYSVVPVLLAEEARRVCNPWFRCFSIAAKSPHSVSVSNLATVQRSRSTGRAGLVRGTGALTLMGADLTVTDSTASAGTTKWISGPSRMAPIAYDGVTKMKLHRV